MDVRLPNGTIVRNVPNDVTQERLIGVLDMNGVDTSALKREVAGKMTVEGMTGPQRVAAGAGKSLVDLGRGAAQLVGLGDQPAIDEAGQRDRALMQTPGGMGGYIGGSVASTVLPGGAVAKGAQAAFMPRVAAAGNALAGGARTYTGAAAGAAVPGILQPVETGQEGFAGVPQRAINTGASAIGGTLGKALGGALSRAATPVESNLTQSQNQALAEALRRGAQATPAMRTGSETLRQIEGSMESFPPTASIARGAREQNQTLINRAAADAMGQASDDVGTGTLRAAEQRIGDIYSRVATNKAVDFGSDMSRPLQSVDSKFRNLGGGKILDHPLIREAHDLDVAGTATRKQLQDLSSRMRREANQEMKSPMGNRELGRALYSTREVIDNALEGDLPKALAKEFQRAREWYRNFATMTENPSVINEASGKINPKSLATALARKDKRGYTLGGNDSDLYAMTRMFEAFPELANSGTATRQFMPWLLGTSGKTALVGGAAGAGYGGLSGDDVNWRGQAGMGAGTGALAPLVAALLSRGGAGAYYSRPMQQYLSGAAGRALPQSEQVKLLADALKRSLVPGGAAAMEQNVQR